MAQQERVKIPRASDRAVMDFFREVGKSYGAPQVNIVAHGLTQIGKVNLEEEPSGDFAVLMELDSELIATTGFVIDGFNVTYHRGGAVGVDEKSPIFDEVALAFNPQQ